MIRREPLRADIRTRLARLAERFRGDPRLTAVYLFGSLARGTADALSDVDLALLFAPGVERGREQELALDYQVEINRVLGTDEVSCVVLDKAPLTLRHEVIASGEVLVDNDPAARLDFEVRSENLYMDFRPLLDAYDDELLRQLTAPRR